MNLVQLLWLTSEQKRIEPNLEVWGFVFLFCFSFFFLMKWDCSHTHTHTHTGQSYILIFEPFLKIMGFLK